jgi:hypothetical protein
MVCSTFGGCCTGAAATGTAGTTVGAGAGGLPEKYAWASPEKYHVIPRAPAALPNVDSLTSQIATSRVRRSDF